MRPLIWERMLQFWKADRGLSIILALLLVIIFVLPVVLTSDSTGRLVADLAFSALLVTGAFTVAESRRIRITVIAFTSAALVVRLAAAGSPSGTLALGREASTLIVLLLFAMIVAARAYRPGPVTHHRIQGATPYYFFSV